MSRDKTFKLKRTTQCVKCPWRVETNPRDIPNGYSLQKHRALSSTIARPGEFNLSGIRAMACHETHDAHCVGWLDNQLGVGNNIGLRMLMMSCSNIGKLRLRGEQHQSFVDTLPDEDE